jgi:hypothetical protein
MEKAEIVDYIIKSRSDRDAVEVATGRSTKRLSTLNGTYYFILERITKKQSDMNSFIYFLLLSKNIPQRLWLPPPDTPFPSVGKINLNS